MKVDGGEGHGVRGASKLRFDKRGVRPETSVMMKIAAVGSVTVVLS